MQLEPIKYEPSFQIASFVQSITIYMYIAWCVKMEQGCHLKFMTTGVMVLELGWDFEGYIVKMHCSFI